MAIIATSGHIGSGKDTIGKIIQYLEAKNKAILDLKMPDRDYWINISFEDYFKHNMIAHSWQIKKFADKLKDIVCLLIGCTREQLEDQDFKDKELGEDWWYYLSPDNIKYNYSDAKYNEHYDSIVGICKLIKLTPRLLLQLIGTDCGRNIIHPNIWVNSLMSEYKPKYKRVHTPPDLKNLFAGYTGTCKNCGGRWNDLDKRQILCKDCIEKQEDVYPNWIISDLRFPNELEAVKAKKGITIRVNRFCYDSLEDYLVTYPEISVSKKATQVVQDWGLKGKDKLEKELKKIPESLGFFKRSTHESETALANATFDYTIENNGTIEELIEKIKQILITEKII